MRTSNLVLLFLVMTLMAGFVVAQPVLTFTPTALTVSAVAGSSGDQTQKAPVLMFNSGSAALYQVFVDQPWVELDSSSGFIDKNQQVTIPLTIVSNTFEAGTYQATLTVVAEQNVTVTFAITLTVSGIKIAFVPDTVSLSVVAGGSTSASAIVTGAGGASGTISVTKESGGPWLSSTSSPASGALPVSVTVMADASTLPQGVYVGKLIATCITGTNCVPKELTVNLTVLGRSSLTVNPTAVSFSTSTAGSPQSQTVNLFNTGADSTYAATVLNAPGITVGPVSGPIKQNQSTPVNIIFSPVGVDVGNYSGSVRFDATGSSTTVNVGISVLGIGVTPSSLSLAVLAGRKTSTTFQVSGTEPFTIRNLSGSPWLTFTPAQGTPPQQITVTVDSAALPVGVSTGTLSINCTTSCSPKTVSVQVTVSPLSIVSSADFKAGLAPGTIAAAFAQGITTITQIGGLPLVNNLGGVSVQVQDSAGKQFQAGLFFVSPNQVNFEIPEGAALGPATIKLSNSDGVYATGTFTITAVAPSLYTANAQGSGPPAAYVVYRAADGTDTPVLLAICDAAVNCGPVSINLARAPLAYLQLYGTGIRNRSDLSRVIVSIGGVTLTPLYAGAQLTYPGLDQVNVVLPLSLAGTGTTTLVLTVDGVNTQPVTLVFQ
jgi:uncharacterized protein (TIGR03437 family)